MNKERKINPKSFASGLLVAFFCNYYIILV